jgi:hypothetical protein
MKTEFDKGFWRIDRQAIDNLRLVRLSLRAQHLQPIVQTAQRGVFFHDLAHGNRLSS